MRKLIYFLIALLIAPLAFAIDECGKTITLGDIPCQITSNWNYTNCTATTAQVYNQSGDNVINYTFLDFGSSGLCYATWNYSTMGSYTGIVSNSDTFNISILGDKQMMSFTVMVFMIVFTLALFLIPMLTRSFTNNKATDYILKNLMYVGGVLFTWFDITLLRQMASDSGLGVDNLLSFVWWALTLGMAIVIFTMCYTTLVGYLQMLKESQLRERMGENE